VNILKSFFLVIIVASTASATGLADCHLVPGWGQEGAARTFGPDNFFEYLDGEAEGYLIYDFLQLENPACKSGSDTLVIDVSEMSDAEGAYGLFLARLDPRQPIARIGMGGQIQSRRAAFAKGKYYVELNAPTDTDRTSILQTFAVAIEKRISGRAVPPDAVGWFPADKLTSVRLIPESVLGIRLLERGYVAQYEMGKAFVVVEASPESAAAVMTKLRQRFDRTLPAQVADEAFEARDPYLGGLCFFRKGRYIAGLANLPEGTHPAELAARLAARLP
jgi:Family of unknown function (DUF6599)